MANENATTTVMASFPRLLLDGEEHGAFMQTLQQLEVVLAPNQPACCRLLLNNWGRTKNGESGYLFNDGGELDHGRVLEVFAGAGDGAERIFHGEIYRLEGLYPADRPPMLEVTAYDRLQRWDQVRRSRSYVQLSDSNLADLLAAEYGLQTDFQLTQSMPPHKALVQIEQSDLEFLRARLEAVDILMWVQEEVLHLESWLSTASQQVALHFGQQILAARLASDLTGQAAELHLPGWTPQIASPLLGIASNASLSGEVGDLQSGPQVYRSVFDTTTDQQLHHRPANTSQATELAEVAFRQRSRRFVSGQLQAVVQPRLRPGGRVALSGLGTRFDGQYRVVSVVHSFDQQGFHTHLQVSRSGQPATQKGKPRPDAPKQDDTLVHKKPTLPGGSQKPGADRPDQQGGQKG
jgi:phage protein D